MIKLQCGTNDYRDLCLDQEVILHILVTPYSIPEENKATVCAVWDENLGYIFMMSLLKFFNLSAVCKLCPNILGAV